MQREEADKLVARIKAGSAEAFGAFYEAYRPYVFKQALQLTKDAAEAEDLCQDIFIEVFHVAEKFDPTRGSVKTWLAVKTRSRFLDRQRKAKRALFYLNQIRWVSRKWETGTDEILLRKANQDELVFAMNTLPESQKKAVFHKYFKEQTQREIARSMNKPIGTIKSLIRYGTINMRKTLIAREYNE